MEAPVAVGIDLGATNCLVAVFRQGRVEIMENLSHGNRFTPSFVCYNNNKILVGQAAKNSFLKNEGNSIYSKDYPGNNIQQFKVLLTFQMLSD